MIRKFLLDNGLTFLAETMPDVRSVTIGVWLRHGSRHEPPRVNGICHFIEHLVFKGTEQRSARDIALALDSVGGQMDAFTSKEFTCFYAKVLDEHVPEAIELLADIVQRPRFDAEELERERQVVLEEIRMVEDTPDELAYDLLAAEMYPANPLGRPIQGTAQTVGSISRRQLVRYFRNAYSPQNMLIAAAGNVKPAALKRRVERAFGKLAPARVSNGKLRRPRHRAGTVLQRKNELEQVHLLLGLPAYAESHADRYALYVMNTILGGAMSSRLFQKVREERGLAYNVYSAVNAFSDTGFLAIYAATNPGAAREVVALVRDELRALRDRGPDPAELEVAREHLKGSLMLSLESTSSRMSNIARQEITFGRQRTLQQMLRQVDRVGVAEVHEVARRVVGRGQPMTLAGVGRVQRLRLGERELTP